MLGVLCPNSDEGRHKVVVAGAAGLLLVVAQAVVGLLVVPEAAGVCFVVMEAVRDWLVRPENAIRRLVLAEADGVWLAVLEVALGWLIMPEVERSCLVVEEASLDADNDSRDCVVMHIASADLLSKTDSSRNLFFLTCKGG